jgi:N utilization substance protein B
MTGAAEKRSKETKAAGTRRSAARLAAVQALYEMDIAGADADDVLEEFLRKRWRFVGADGTPEENDEEVHDSGKDAGPLTEPDGEWLDDLVHGVATRRDELDGLIGPALVGEWTVDRLETLLRVILRAGVYELVAKPDVPAAVVITEYLEVAHAFFEGKEASLVNGVLDHLARDLRTGELDGPGR